MRLFDFVVVRQVRGAEANGRLLYDGLCAVSVCQYSCIRPDTNLELPFLQRVRYDFVLTLLLF